jgi:MEDS: MEthanogen/methylotroph, DcmR Sensory domain/Histidine kinase-like ATPase domain
MTDDRTTLENHGAELFHGGSLLPGKGELARAIHAFVKEGVAAGEPVLAAVAREEMGWLRETLSHHAAEVRFEDMHEVGINPSRLLPMIQEWIDDHDGCARVISEPIWPGRSYAETVECLRHEALINHALTNALRHGDGRCRARIWRDGQSVISEISSDTAGPDVLAGRRRPSPDAISGRGLWLINQVCDLVELRSSDTGMTLRMHVR